MLNKVFLMGRLTKDPEMRYTSGNNIPIARFTLAVDRRFKNSQTGERDTDFINCIAWNKTAEFVNNYFFKGKMMVLNGRIQTRSWEDQEGKRRFATDVVGEEIFFGDSKGSNNTQQTNTGVEQDEGFFPVDNDDELPF